jgi:hypothetical protein
MEFPYIEIINNSEKYIEMLKQKDIIYINSNDVKPSNDLVKRDDTLWGYYHVKSFKVNNSNVKPDEIFVDYYVSCGDCFLGECLLQKKKKNSFYEKECKK